MPGWFSNKFNNKFVFQILNLQLLIFYMDDLENIANFYYVWFLFSLW